MNIGKVTHLPDGATVRAMKSGRMINVGDDVTEDDGGFAVSFTGRASIPTGAIGIRVDDTLLATTPRIDV